jgi:hypothetical protein
VPAAQLLLGSSAAALPSESAGQAAALLRHAVAVAAGVGAPRISPEAHDFLTQVQGEGLPGGRRGFSPAANKVINCLPASCVLLHTLPVLSRPSPLPPANPAQYASILRQSTLLPCPQSEVVEALARAAHACAALGGRREAADVPDAVLAALLVDRSMVNRVRQ